MSRCSGGVGVGLHALPPDSTGRNVVYVGSGNSRVPEDLNVQNYFWAVEDNTGESCDGEALWGVYLNKAAGEKVPSGGQGGNQVAGGG